MSGTPVVLASLNAGQMKLFRELTSVPKYSWPVITQWVAVMTLYIGANALAVLGGIPLWLAMITNSLLGNVAFNVTHESLHRSVSTNKLVNDWVGQSALLLAAPYVDLRLFRWGHILHHRFTAGPRDPDNPLFGAWWTLPFRWAVIDVIYLIYALRHGDKISRPYLRSSILLGLITAIVFGALISLGYGWHLLILWFIPSRLIFISLGFSFFWLPHVMHDTAQEENLTLATTVRIGQEWLFGPLLQGHNYHLIHHLYPMTPSYNLYKVWRLIEPDLRKRDLAVQHGFAIQPTFYPGSKP